VDQSNLIWCSDDFEIGCDNGEKVRIAFMIDFRDREALAFVATTEGITGEDIQNLMITAVRRCFGPVDRLPHIVVWQTTRASSYLAAGTRALARKIGLEPHITPARIPQWIGAAEALVRTVKRDYVRVSPCPDARTVIAQLAVWFEHYNAVRRYRALG
jgi:putative transposase